MALRKLFHKNSKKNLSNSNVLEHDTHGSGSNNSTDFASTSSLTSDAIASSSHKGQNSQEMSNSKEISKSNDSAPDYAGASGVNVQNVAAMRKKRGLGVPKSQNPSTNGSHGTMLMGSAAKKRLDILSKMGQGHDDKFRARSVMTSDKSPAAQSKGKSKKTGSPTEEEIRRHSMVPNKKTSGAKESVDASPHPSQAGPNLKQYRIKNEIFALYEYYHPVKIIGVGAYAVVCEAIDTRTGDKVAVKKNKGVFDDITDARRILREIKLLMHFSHSDIIDLVNVIPPALNEIDSFNNVYLVMPRMETNLGKIIRSKQKLSDRHFQYFLYQIVRGLKYIHSSGVIHRDLKPENVLVNGSDCNVKITDFGLARGVSKEDIEKPTQYVVTRWYRSPEVMCSAGNYDDKIDIWSVGCIFGELILRRPIFPGQNYLDQLKVIFDIMGTPDKQDLTWIKTPEAKKWVQKLKANPGKDLEKLFAKATPVALDLLKKMLVLDPNNRINSIEAMEHEYFASLHRKTKEKDLKDCPKFDLSFEFEKSIKTKFGVRHMMYDALMGYVKNKNAERKDTNTSAKTKMSKSTDDEKQPE